MTEVAHPGHFSDVLFSPSIDESRMTKEKRIYDKVNSLSGGGGVGHSEDVANIWEEEESDGDEERVAGHSQDSRRYEENDLDLNRIGEGGSEMDQFVENEFQFLDSDDDEGEGRGSAADAPVVLGTLTNHQKPETPDESLSPPSPVPSLRDLSDPDALESADAALSSAGVEAPVEALRSSLSHESLDVYEVPAPYSPPIPAPPPLPPTGVLLAVNAHSYISPETVHGAGKVPVNTRPKDRPRNEPQSPENPLFLELQGILNRRLKKINEDIERNESSAAAAAVALPPVTLARGSLYHPMPPSHSGPPLEQTALSSDHHLNSLLPEVGRRTEESEAPEEENNRAIPLCSIAHMEDSPASFLEENSAVLLHDPAFVEPAAVKSFSSVLPDASEMMEESITGGKQLNLHGMVDHSNLASVVPGQVKELEREGTTEAQSIKREVEEKLRVPGDETVRTLNADEQLQPVMETLALHPLTPPVSVPDLITSNKPQSASVRLPSNQFHGSPNPSAINAVETRTGLGVTRPRPSSAVVHGWETTSGDEWTPQMDLLDDEFDDDDDFPQEIITRRIHHTRRPDPSAAEKNRRPQKRTPSKLYQKRQQLGGGVGGPPERLPHPHPGAFSLARINRAVKRVFGSISSKPPSSKQRTPISDGVFLQEEGWEIYPSRPYDQSNPDEAVKVVGVESRPAYAYNAVTRQLVILPDHDRILVTDDGRRIRDQDQRPPTGRTTRPTSPGRNTNTGNREKPPRFASKSKASNPPPQPPNLNTKTVKSIHMHHHQNPRPESVVEDGQTTADEAYWRRNSTPNSAGGGGGGGAAPNAAASNLKRKTPTLSQILSFRKSAQKSTVNGKKGTNERMTSSDLELLKRGGGQATRP